jgi:hypothetical protein
VRREVTTSDGVVVVVVVVVARSSSPFSRWNAGESVGGWFYFFVRLIPLASTLLASLVAERDVIDHKK